MAKHAKPQQQKNADHIVNMLAQEHARQQAASAKPKASNLIDILDGTSGPLHAIHVRLIEMIPFIDEAIAAAEGDVKCWLQALESLIR